ncbi:hypothetical protein C9374_003357 [Naegleria lovaniensis]|uniref:Uncharacterized protein n=1 Tax=Naegleria lovaniensis TaxID=51637 RepID=A0AA88KPL6_NAELO|nr:uncharacterized protein C9374_003357 [Naegleria lovaniensis]KAG2385542.1 hypothetical protein C9374_003357 [Naegleria lovaniensis]
MSSNYTTNNTSASFICPYMISSQDAGLGFLCACLGGILGILFLVPTPILTKLLHRKTLWKFENSWIQISFFALVFWPIVALFCQGLVPISSLEYYFTTSLNGTRLNSTTTSSTMIVTGGSGTTTTDQVAMFQAEDWVSVIIAHCFWVLLSFSTWALATEWIGFGWSTKMVYGVGVFFVMMAHWIAGTDIDYIWSNNDATSYPVILPVPVQYHFYVNSSKGIVYCIAIPVMLIGLISLAIAYVFVERNTREQRTELEMSTGSGREHMTAAVNWTEVAKKEANSNKNVARTIKMRVVIKFYIAMFVTVLASILYFLYEGAFLANVTNHSFSLMTKLQKVKNPNDDPSSSSTSTPPLNQFQSKVFINGISFPISYCFVFIACVLLLLYNRTIKKMALCSGGCVCMSGQNIRGYRILGLISSFFQGLIWYGSILLLNYAEYLFKGRGSFPILVYSFFAIVTSMICGLSFLELRGTLLPERVVIIISYICILAALILLSYAAFPSHFINLIGANCPQ